MNEKLVTGSKLIRRAIELEEKNNYSESLVCYQEGLQVYMDYSSHCPAEEKKKLGERMKQYFERAEQVKEKAAKQKKLANYHEEIVISENEMGHSYESVFGKYLDCDVKIVKIEDPYIHKHHQISNFLRLCELLVKKCSKLTKIILATKIVEAQQNEAFSTLGFSLKQRNVDLEVQNASDLHDRQIWLSNGWRIKLGRGLDYFKGPPNNYCLGYHDLDLRQCHRTNIDIFYDEVVNFS